jgi:hypothetical protein
MLNKPLERSNGFIKYLEVGGEVLWVALEPPVAE